MPSTPSICEETSTSLSLVRKLSRPSYLQEVMSLLTLKPQRQHTTIANSCRTPGLYSYSDFVVQTTSTLGQRKEVEEYVTACLTLPLSSNPWTGKEVKCYQYLKSIANNEKPVCAFICNLAKCLRRRLQLLLCVSFTFYGLVRMDLFPINVYFKTKS